MVTRFGSMTEKMNILEVFLGFLFTMPWPVKVYVFKRFVQ